MTAPLRLLVILVAGALTLVFVKREADERRPPDGALLTEDGDTVAVTEQARAAGLRFGASIPPADREWIRATLALARPEAARLLAEVDGMTTVHAGAAGGPDTPLGVASGDGRGFRVEFDLGRLNGDRTVDRAMVVLHEFGHVIDFALVDRATAAALDEQIPRIAACGVVIGCDKPEERFADTFAKWALRGAVSQAGAGYGIPMPPSLETWGEPLGRLALTLPAA